MSKIFTKINGEWTQVSNGGGIEGAVDESRVNQIVDSKITDLNFENVGLEIGKLSLGTRPNASLTTDGEDNKTKLNITFPTYGILEVGEVYDLDSYGVVLVEPGNCYGTWAYCDSQGEPIYLDDNYFNRHPIFSKIETQVIDGQYMVRIPKFYMKYERPDSGIYQGKLIRYLSPIPKEDYHIYPAFMNTSKEIDQFWFGAYEGSYSGSKLCSLPGTTPASVTFANIINYANNRNTNGISGFMTQDVYQRFCIQMLFLMRYCTTDAQGLFGQGYTGIGTVDPIKSNDSKLGNPIFGIYGLYGNAGEFVQGLTVNSCKFSIWDNKGNRNLISTGITTGTGQFYPRNCAETVTNDFNLGDCFLPLDSDNLDRNLGTYGTMNTYISSSSTPNLLMGGNMSGGKYYGLYSFFATATASTNRNTGRLCKI